MKHMTARRSFRQFFATSGRGAPGVSRLAARVLLPFILLSFVIASAASADTLILATGVSGGSQLAQSVIDPNWTVTGAPGYSATYVLGPTRASGTTGEAAPGFSQPRGASWNAGNAQWIGPERWNSNANGVSSWPAPPAGAQVLPTGTYTYQTTSF